MNRKDWCRNVASIDREFWAVMERIEKDEYASVDSVCAAEHPEVVRDGLVQRIRTQADGERRRNRQKYHAALDQYRELITRP